MYILQKHLKLLIFVFTVITSYSGYGQGNTIQLHGKITNSNNDVSEILIVNLNYNKSTITDSLGFFTIEVRSRDSLQFTAVQYQTKQIVITDAIFDQKTVLVNLVENTINLEEVIVTPYNLSGKLNRDLERLNIEPIVNSSTLGLPNANLDVMTQSERLLLEADRGKYVYYYGIALVINLYKIMNKASGRTKSLKDMVARDAKMELEKEIINKFSKKAMSEDFDIPETNIDGFLTYCLSQTDFSELSKVGNTGEIWDYLKASSTEFKKTVLHKE